MSRRSQRKIWRLIDVDATLSIPADALVDDAYFQYDVNDYLVSALKDTHRKGFTNTLLYSTCDAMQAITADGFRGQGHVAENRSRTRFDLALNEKGCPTGGLISSSSHFSAGLHEHGDMIQKHEVLIDQQLDARHLNPEQCVGKYSNTRFHDLVGAGRQSFVLDDIFFSIMIHDLIRRVSEDAAYFPNINSDEDFKGIYGNVIAGSELDIALNQNFTTHEQQWKLLLEAGELTKEQFKDRFVAWIAQQIDSDLFTRISEIVNFFNQITWPAKEGGGDRTAEGKAALFMSGKGHMFLHALQYIPDGDVIQIVDDKKAVLELSEILANEDNRHLLGDRKLQVFQVAQSNIGTGLETLFLQNIIDDHLFLSMDDIKEEEWRSQAKDTFIHEMTREEFNKQDAIYEKCQPSSRRFHIFYIRENELDDNPSQVYSYDSHYDFVKTYRSYSAEFTQEANRIYDLQQVGPSFSFVDRLNRGLHGVLGAKHSHADARRNVKSFYTPLNTRTAGLEKTTAIIDNAHTLLTAPLKAAEYLLYALESIPAHLSDKLSQTKPPMLLKPFQLLGRGLLQIPRIALAIPRHALSIVSSPVRLAKKIGRTISRGWHGLADAINDARHRRQGYVQFDNQGGEGIEAASIQRNGQPGSSKIARRDALPVATRARTCPEPHMDLHDTVKEMVKYGGSLYGLPPEAQVMFEHERIEDDWSYKGPSR
jgi:hypothetical protein